MLPLSPLPCAFIPLSLHVRLHGIFVSLAVQLRIPLGFKARLRLHWFAEHLTQCRGFWYNINHDAAKNRKRPKPFRKLHQYSSAAQNNDLLRQDFSAGTKTTHI